MPETNHDGETLKQAVDRLSDNIEDPFDRHSKSRGRLGYKDLPHAITNIPVTLAREQPRLAGHLWLYMVLGLLVVIGVVVFIGILW